MKNGSGAAGRRVALGLVQMAMGEDREANVAKAISMVSEASRRGATVVCLPELFPYMYFPQSEDADVDPEPIPGPTTRRLSEAARDARVAIVGGSLYEKGRGGRLYNTSVVFDERGRMLGKYRKVHVPQDEAFYEKDYFSSGRDYGVFKAGGARVGVLICFDQWFPEPARVNKLMGAELLFYPTAIGSVDGIEETEGDWKEAWEAVQRGHAIANSLVVSAVNRVGREGRTRFWGGSFVCDQFGTVVARADEREQVVVAECDLELGRQVEAGWGFLRNRAPKTYRRLVR